MTAPLDLDAIKEMQRAVMALVYEVPEQVWADVRERWNAVVTDVERLRAESVPRSALVQVGWRHPEGYVCAEERWSWCRTRPCADQPVYVIREDSDA